MIVKFHAWNINEAYMMGNADNLLVSFRGDVYIVNYEDKLRKHSPVILRRYTGKHDKYGYELYEGDLLHFDFEDYPNTSGIYLITWDEEDCCFACERKAPYNFLLPEVWCEGELIGNKYENPRLIPK